MPLLRAALSWNFVLVTAVCASLLAQLIKVLLNLFIFHRFIAERMWGAGGMPSSHSATVCALVTAVCYEYGAGSFEFAISLILANASFFASSACFGNGKSACMISSITLSFLLFFSLSKSNFFAMSTSFLS